MDENENNNNDADANSDLIKFDPSKQCLLTCARSKLIKSNAILALINITDATSSEEIWYKFNSIA